MPDKIEIQFESLKEEGTITSGWLNTFSRSALGLMWLIRDWLKGSEIKSLVHTVIEFAVAKHYWQKTGEVIFVPVGRFKGYDGISQSKVLCFETKFEKLARDTFNLCFEYWCKGKPSGLAATEAKKWVHVVPVDEQRLCCYEFDVETLRETLRNFPTYKGGDNNQSVFKLLPLFQAEKLTTSKFEISINWDEIKPYW